MAFPNLYDHYKEIHGIDLTADIKGIESVFEPLNIPLSLKKGDVTKMPYEDNTFDTVLLVSKLEHLKADELERAMIEVRRVLKPGGQMVYGTPVEKPFMVFMFRLLNHNIRDEHFQPKRKLLKPHIKFFQKATSFT